jgi:AraC family transcriptional regulator
MKKRWLKTLVFTLVLTLIFSIALIWAFSSSEGQQLPAPGKVEIRQVEPFVYCSLSRKGSFSEIEAAVGELMQHMQNQNVFPTGSMIEVYHGDPSLSDPDSIQWEVGFPINEQAFVQAPLQKKQWTFTAVAVGVHEGPYEKTGETILKMREWLEENGYVQNGPVLERYLDPDPSRTTPDRLKTEIWLPCKKA